MPENDIFCWKIEDGISPIVFLTDTTLGARSSLAAPPISTTRSPALNPSVARINTLAPVKRPLSAEPPGRPTYDSQRRKGVPLVSMQRGPKVSELLERTQILGGWGAKRQSLVVSSIARGLRHRARQSQSPRIYLAKRVSLVKRESTTRFSQGA